MEKCKICGRQFKDVDMLLNHIADEHGADNNKLIEITPELCTELGLTESQINVIKATVATGATDAELMYFLQAAAGLGLNPINKEIYFMKMGGKVTLVTGRDGYLKIAQRNPLFRGLHSSEVCEKDVFEVTTSTVDGKMVQDVKHTINSMVSRGKVVGAWARAEMDGMAPVVVIATMEEYGKNTTTWKQYESAMMRKVPEAIALKRVCGISGMVTAAEIADEHSPKALQEMEVDEDQVSHMQKAVNDAVFERESDDVADANFTDIEPGDESDGTIDGGQNE